MAQVVVNDLSGNPTPLTPNPYDGLIEVCNNDPKLIQDRYSTHRQTRNAQQKAKILSPDFEGWILDPVLTKLEGPQRDASFTDPRNCLVFWARPPTHIFALIEQIQRKLREVAPGIWLMPLPNLHMTAMEVTHSLTAPKIDALVETLQPECERIADMPGRMGMRARLVKPMVSFDAAALALSFVPAAGEVATDQERKPQDDAFTYHHLRRDLHAAITESGVTVGSRYIVPSAHLTVARFNTPNPFDLNNELDAEAGRRSEYRERLMKQVDAINTWLTENFWAGSDSNGIATVKEGEFVVGTEKGLDFHKGTLWYGGGELVYLGKSNEAQQGQA